MNYKHIISCLGLSFLLLSTPLTAQKSPEWNGAKILQKMKRLNTLGSVLYLAAHPDDENTRLIAYLVGEKHYRTAYLSMTRGDGGQNLLGNEKGPALGLLRTQELLDARRNDGAKQFFTRAYDFGYVKSAKETFKIWNEDSIVSDAVLTIRRFKPDVVVLRFPTTGEGGHGHHTASAFIGKKAFKLAGDSTKFAWQLKLPGVSVWQPKRIFWNTFKFGSVNTTSPKQLQINVGGYNPLLGKSYGQISAASRSMHKSQGFGVAPYRDQKIEYFKLLKGPAVNHKDSSLMVGINTSWSRLPNTKKIQSLLQKLIQGYQESAPQKSIPLLTKIYSAIQNLPNDEPSVVYWKKHKLKLCKQLILACSGTWLEATANDFRIVPGEDITVTANIITRSSYPIQLTSIDFLHSKTQKVNESLQKGIMKSIKKTCTISDTTSYSNPYWLNLPHTKGMYQVKNRKLIGLPENKSHENVFFHLVVNSIPLTIKRPLAYKYLSPVRGQVYRPFEILPPVTINLSNGVFVFNDTLSKEIRFTVQANKDNVKGKLSVHAPKGWTIKIENPEINIEKKGKEQEVKAMISPSPTAKDGTISASVSINGKKYTKSIVRISYPHIPSQFFLKKAQAKVIHLDLKKKGGNLIGYIPGSGDEIPAALQQIGYKVQLLTNELLKKIDLGQFSAIVTGVRAYNINKDLSNYYDKLMQYVHNGGNLIVQYNTNSRLGPLKQKIGPYPFTISRNRVTDETAKVTFLHPDGPVVSSPNKITQKDFKGWIQERGTYFAVDLDKHYHTVFEMHDQGEKDHKGSLIYAKYGKGYFVYSGIVFFRELPAGVPGAYRLFVNLLSLGK